MHDSLMEQIVDIPVPRIIEEFAEMTQPVLQDCTHDQIMQQLAEIFVPQGVEVNEEVIQITSTEQDVNLPMPLDTDENR